MGAVLAHFFLRGRQPNSDAGWAAMQTEMQAEVATLMPRVQLWSHDAFTELHTYRNLKWVAFGRQARARGLVAAAKNKKQRAWAAFSLRGRRVYNLPVAFVGKAHARTSVQSLDYEADASGQVVIQVDGRMLGSLQPDGQLLSASGEPIGQVARLARDRSTRPVTLNGREVAQLENPYYGGYFRFLKNIPRPPAVEFTAPDVTPAERDWLLALALWQVINRAAAQINTSGV
ncbi:MAG: hypothetical protein D6803_08455 [Anaerolineae bacterium]|nr:MAG: hypothetical protein D6803_08455 [Anaerolineae bacterium]